MTYTYKAHSPAKRKSIPWSVCKNCGLVYLNNDFTRWCIKMGCTNRDHPDELAVRIKLTRRQI